MFTSTPALETALRATSAEDLQRAYIWSINSALESGGNDLADELADGYRHESRALPVRHYIRKAA
ncbi:MAG TPA: hypothetical protein VHX15_02485 [Frankiaceae bacterium]|jgi:hypothetical protein|nr:hypothetical protein [Frankiaceae bacterium]